jgi:putative transport protein
MELLRYLFSGESVTSDIMIAGLVGAIGLALGSVRIFKVKFGISGVFFAGLLFGHFGLHINSNVSDFLRQLGLVVFVYSIGMQIGPGFLASLKKQGLKLNLLALGIVLSGTILAVVIGKLADLDVAVLVGMLAGATTNTASLAAAQETLRLLPEHTSQMETLPGLGYAVAYPFGIVGIILAMLVIRGIFRIRLDDKSETDQPFQPITDVKIERIFIKIENENLDGVRIRDIPNIANSGVVVSRVIQDDKFRIAQSDMVIKPGQIIVAAGEIDKLKTFASGLGSQVHVDVAKYASNHITKWMIVTKSNVLGKTLRSLGLREHYGVNVTRMSRAEYTLCPSPDMPFHYGDRLYAIGPPEALKKVAEILGNSHEDLNHPKLASMFLGVILGLVLGSIPIQIPGIPNPIKLGIAGGPMIMAILLSWLGRIGPVVWYIPKNVNLGYREVGIVLFYVSVGLTSGEYFVQTLVSGDGLLWMALAAIVTAGPALIFGLIARIFSKLNYTSICGLLAGSTTNPPALSFAGDQTHSESPYVTYATVYPLCTILRITLIQLIVIFYGNL